MGTELSGTTRGGERQNGTALRDAAADAFAFTPFTDGFTLRQALSAIGRSSGPERCGDAIVCDGRGVQLIDGGKLLGFLHQTIANRDVGMNFLGSFPGGEISRLGAGSWGSVLFWDK